MRTAWRKVRLFVGFSLLALLLIGITGVIWGAFVYLNIRTVQSVPWCLPAMVAVLWLMWRYLGGAGWPRSTSATRKSLLRAYPVSGQVFAWTAVAGMLAIAALAGLWIVAFQLFRMPPNLLLPANFTTSPFLVVGIIVGASLVAPITEESAVRGYLQTILEREFTPLTAVVLSSLVFALAHVTQGLAWPKLTVYFLVGVTFGTMAYLNNSILPVIPVHVAGDLIFFVFVWPHDPTRKLVWQNGADTWFWLHVAQAIACAAMSVIAFQRLHAVTQSDGVALMNEQEKIIVRH